MKKVPEKHEYTESVNVYKDFESLMLNIFWLSFQNIIHTIIQTPEQFAIIIKDIIIWCINNRRLLGGDDIDTKLSALSLEKDIEKALKMIWDIEWNQKTHQDSWTIFEIPANTIIHINNRKILFTTTLKGILAGIREWLKKHTDEFSLWNLNEIMHL